MGTTEVTLRLVGRRKQLLDNLKEKRGYWNLEKGGYSVENSLCKKLYTICKTDYGMNERTISSMIRFT